MNKTLIPWYYDVLNQLFGWSRFWKLRGGGYSVKNANITMMRAKLTPALRWKILWRDNFICYRCKRRFRAKDLDVDHVSALGAFWDKLGFSVLIDEKNLRACCRHCNRSKGVKEV